MNPDVAELLNYNNGLQFTHLAEWKTATWQERLAACGRKYLNSSKRITHYLDLVDCPSCLRATPTTAKETT